MWLYAEVSSRETGPWSATVMLRSAVKIAAALLSGLDDIRLMGTMKATHLTKHRNVNCDRPRA